MTAACAACGSTFTPQRSSARFCSDRCKKAARRASTALAGQKADGSSRPRLARPARHTAAARGPSGVRGRVSGRVRSRAGRKDGSVRNEHPGGHCALSRMDHRAAAEEREMTKKQMEREWLRPGVRDPCGAPGCIEPSKELIAKIRRECPRNAKQLIAAFGRERTRYDAKPDYLTKPSSAGPAARET